jgi:hypothetical protein
MISMYFVLSCHDGYAVCERKLKTIAEHIKY